MKWGLVLPVGMLWSPGFVRSTWPVRGGASRGDWMRRLNSAPLPGAPDEGKGGTPDSGAAPDSLGLCIPPTALSKSLLCCPLLILGLCPVSSPHLPT